MRDTSCRFCALLLRLSASAAALWAFSLLGLGYRIEQEWGAFGWCPPDQFGSCCSIVLLVGLILAVLVG